MLLNNIKKKILELIFYVKLFIIKRLHKIIVPKKINIGGGSNFNEFSWLNYDVNSILTPFKFNENISLPNKDNSINTVYTSHTLEHFSDKVVNKVLNEINRVLISRGSLLIIIPDYDFIIKKWREKDWNFFCNSFDHEAAGLSRSKASASLSLLIRCLSPQVCLACLQVVSVREEAALTLATILSRKVILSSL